MQAVSRILLGLSVAAFGSGQAAACTLAAWGASGGGIFGAVVSAQPNHPTPSARYSGHCGIRGPATGSYVADGSPADEKTFHAGFHVFTGLSSGSAVFLEAPGPGQPLFTLEFDASGTRIVARTQGGSQSLPGIQSGRWYFVQVDWAVPGVLTTDEVAPGTLHVLVTNDALPIRQETVVPGVGIPGVQSMRLGWISGSGVVMADAKRAGIIVDNYDSARHGRIQAQIRGDANGDQQVTAGDAVAVQQEIQGQALAPGQPDCTQDGLVNSDDVSCIQGLAFAARLVSTPPPGVAVQLSASVGTASIRSPLLVTNDSRGSSSLAVNSCSLGGSSALSFSPAALLVPVGETHSITVACDVPAIAGGLETATLSCSTNDPARATISYPIQCRATDTPVGGGTDLTAGAAAQGGDRLAEVVAIGDAVAGQEVVVVGSPYGGTGNDGQLLVFEGEVATKLLRSDSRERSTKLPTGNSPTATIDLSTIGGVVGDKFAGSLAVSPDGGVIALGAPAQGIRGRLYVFRRPVDGWQGTSVPEVIEAPPATGAVSPLAFGDEVAFGPDGTLLVGAPGSTVAGIDRAGAAYVLRDSGGFGFVGSALLANQAKPRAAFASSLALTVDQLVLGAPTETVGAVQEAGAVYVFPVIGGIPSPPEQLVRSDGALGDKFGTRVVVVGDSVGGGSPGDDNSAGTNSGSATLFRRPGPAGLLAETSTLLPAAGADQAAGLAMAATEDQLILGAPLARVNNRYVRGRVYTYDIDAGIASGSLGIIDSAIDASNQGFGETLAAGRRVILTGVPGADPTPEELDRGRLDVFVLDRIFRGTFE